MDNDKEEKEYEGGGELSHQDRLKQSKCIKAFSVLSGCVVPIATCYFLFLFAYGSFRLSDEDDCYSVEYPNDQ